MSQTKILLDESEIPTHWYNVIADMPNPCEVMPGVFVETHYQANDLRDLIARVAEKYELEDEIFFELER